MSNISLRSSSVPFLIRCSCFVGGYFCGNKEAKCFLVVTDRRYTKVTITVLSIIIIITTTTFWTCTHPRLPSPTTNVLVITQISLVIYTSSHTSGTFLRTHHFRSSSLVAPSAVLLSSGDFCHRRPLSLFVDGIIVFCCCWLMMPPKSVLSLALTPKLLIDFDLQHDYGTVCEQTHTHTHTLTIVGKCCCFSHFRVTLFVGRDWSFVCWRHHSYLF